MSDPAAVPVGTVRVHPDDAPADPAARRYVLTDDRDDAHDGDPTPWDLLTGNDHDEVGQKDLSRSHDDVADWPTQPLADLAAVLGHAS